MTPTDKLREKAREWLHVGNNCGDLRHDPGCVCEQASLAVLLADVRREALEEAALALEKLYLRYKRERFFPLDLGRVEALEVVRALKEQADERG